MIKSTNTHKICLVLCFATKAEAQPWLDFCKCSLVFQKKSILLYENEHGYILISGIGAVKMASAIGWLFGFLKLEEALMVNIGCAGGPVETLHKWHNIVSVEDEETQQFFYPEIIEPVEKIEYLVTCSSPKNKAWFKQNNKLADMEAFAFAKTAQNFVSNNHIQILKWVSDSGDINFFKNKDWINKYSHEIDDILNSILHTKQKLENLHFNNSELKDWVNKFSSKIEMSKSQTILLHNALNFNFLYHNHKKIEHLYNNLNNDKLPKNKRNSIFNDLIQKLYAH